MPRINCNGRHKHPFLQAGSPQYANIYGWFINIYPLTQAPALILVDHVEESLDLLLLGPVAGACHCHQCQCQCQCRWCLNQLFAFGFGRSPEHFCQPLLVTWDMTSWWNWLYQPVLLQMIKLTLNSSKSTLLSPVVSKFENIFSTFSSEMSSQIDFGGRY